MEMTAMAEVHMEEVNMMYIKLWNIFEIFHFLQLFSAKHLLGRLT